MAGMAGVREDPLCLPPAPLAVEVPIGWQHSPGDALTTLCRAPGRDAASQDTLDGTHVEVVEYPANVRGRRAAVSLPTPAVTSSDPR